MILLLFYLFLALTVSFLCSISEVVLLSTTQSFLNAKEERGDKSAKKLSLLKQNIDRPLSAILSLNTVAHTVGAAGVGAQATKIFGEAYFGIVSAILTILILVLTEILPKTIGARYWKELAMIIGTIISGMIFIAYPLVKITEYITKFISSNKNEQTTSREELSALANIATEEGVFEKSENEIIQNLIKLKSVKLYEIMTHRTDIIALPVCASLDEVTHIINKEKYSRIPVYEGNIDNIIGVMHSKYLIGYLTDEDNKQKFNLRNIIRQPYFVPIFKKTDELFKEINENKNHMAIIVDEYGGTSGIVTLEDLIEEVIGNIFDEDDEFENDILKVDENTFIINGSISLDDVKDFLEVDLPTEEYETLSGFLIAQLGRMPDKDEYSVVEFKGMVFKVEQADEKTISKVKVCKM